jgi:radical SAM protein with 4Fe4S-binding SPASM domain
METTLEMRGGAQRDNAGYFSAKVTIPHGCKGPACPAFAICQGRCAVRRTEREAAATRT